MIRLIREHRGFFFGMALAGLALRLFFFFHFPAITDDSRIYADLATNWLNHGVYGRTQGGHPELPILLTDARLPGYPAFLAAIFWLFGAGNFRAVFLAQIAADLATCFVVADLARRTISNRAASDRVPKVAFALAALCPFAASYASAGLTEALEVFLTALALDGAVSALAQMREKRAGSLWAATGLAIAGCILLRPDGGIVLAAVTFYLFYGCFFHERVVDHTHPRPSLGGSPLRRTLTSAVIVAVFALAPLIPWTARNLRTLHQFQPLAPRYAQDTDEFVPRGFNRWVKTWMADYVSVEEIYWNVPGNNFDASKLPDRAFDNAAQRQETLALIDQYNGEDNDEQDITPEIDANFAKLAEQRIQAHGLRYYVALPVLRVADMWLRPRTELLPCDPRWWEFNDDGRHSAAALGLGLLNLACVLAAVWALILCPLLARSSNLRFAGLLLLFILLRSIFLGTIENPEPRYTLECYPAVLVAAAAVLAKRRSQTGMSGVGLAAPLARS